MRGREDKQFGQRIQGNQIRVINITGKHQIRRFDSILLRKCEQLHSLLGMQLTGDNQLVAILQGLWQRAVGLKQTREVLPRIKATRCVENEFRLDAETLKHR
ncbi:Uncharacterized conserved protein [Pseudomonas syringae pv. actinidiae]|uniref:Uncharacterized conserved protein n=1 Tax=Pseudomonas syringae pv. actinidiae TaxID=103796 RepID=A0A2V0Q5P5_PSESF|nr:Uncharacterized conserved protein [Pseudomonas syringae pv. actinidiae]